MALFYASIPFMVLAVAVAVAPLMIAMKHELRLGQYPGVVRAEVEADTYEVVSKAS
jgi:hypothetical protein